MDDAIKQRFEEAKKRDLVEFASSLTTLHRRYLNGPCPVCGGRDRFYITKDRERFACRKCELFGDIIDLAVAVWNISPMEAVNRLIGDDGLPVAQPVQLAPEWVSDTWQASAKQIVAATKFGPPIQERGLESVAALFGLGIGSTYDWKRETERPAIVIPWYTAKRRHICAIKYRLVDGEMPKYLSKAGSEPVLFGIDHIAGESRSLAVTEGELNACSIKLAVPEMDVVSIGSQSSRKALGTLQQLRGNYDSVFVWMDDVKYAKEISGLLEGKYVFSENSRVRGKLDANGVLVGYGAEYLREIVISGNISIEG